MENIALIRRRLGLSQKELAKQLGVHYRTIQQWEHGGVIPDSKKEFIEKLASGELINVSSAGQSETRPRIPAHLAAGTLTGFADPVTADQCEMQPLIRNFPDYDYTIIVKGNSMEPKFEGGDEVAIKKVTSFIEWGKTYVLDTRDGAVIKKIYDAGDSFRCVSFNEDYPDFLVRREDVFGVYKVVGLLRT